VDDELYAELSELEGQKVVLLEVWEDSLEEALDPAAEQAAEQTAPSSFDIDIYLADGAYFELYSAMCFDDLDGEPWLGLDSVRERLTGLAKRGATLDEIAVDQDDQLVLVLRYGQNQRLYVPAAAWLLDEWDELPG
jgi:hypothetical protein